MPAERGAQLIAEDILKEAREKADEIVRGAKKDAHTKLDAARLGAREEKERELREARIRAGQIREEVLAEGRMKAKREVLRAREEIINEVLKEAEDRLRRYVSTKKYEADLIRIAVDTCKKLGSDQVVIWANHRDLKLLEKYKEQIERKLGGGEKSVSVSLGGSIQTIGGVRVGTPDGKVEIDETFEGRMRRESEALRVKIAKILSEGVE